MLLNSFTDNFRPCVRNCPKSTFAEADTGICKACTHPCESCVSSGSTQGCTSCITGHFLFEKKCLQQCPEGYYEGLYDWRQFSQAGSECGTAMNFINMSSDVTLHYQRCLFCRASSYLWILFMATGLITETSYLAQIITYASIRLILPTFLNGSYFSFSPYLPLLPTWLII